MYLFLKKKSGIFSFRVNGILTSILSALHPFLTLPDDDLKRERGSGNFCRFQVISWKAQKGTLFAVGSDVVKSGKKVPFQKYKIVFSSFWEAIKKPTDWQMSTVNTSWASMNDAQFFLRILGDIVKIEMVYKGNQQSKKF